MKKILYFSIVFIMLVASVLPSFASAPELTNVTVTTDKTKVVPGTDVVLTVNFGTELGSYEVAVDYDDTLFDFVSTDGGTEGGTAGNLIVLYFDDTLGTNTKSSMNMVFRAKNNITTSNPTDFAVTLTGLANGDASELYDDILTPIRKNLRVEPDYVPYTIAMNTKAVIMPEEDVDMNVTISSPMGEYYDNLRLIATVTTPDGANVKLIGTELDGTKVDIIQSGWGDPTGIGLGGVVNETLRFVGTFSHLGKYTLTLNLIDRDDSDNVIASVTRNITVGEEELPEELPKTGLNLYAVLGVTMLLCAMGIVIWNQSKD